MPDDDATVTPPPATDRAPLTEADRDELLWWRDHVFPRLPPDVRRVGASMLGKRLVLVTFGFGLPAGVSRGCNHDPDPDEADQG